MHILIVEDEPQMAGLLTRGLEEESYQVSVARDGRAALEITAVQAFDVILLDVGLPGLNGIAAARQIRKLVPDAKIIFLTQESSPEVVAEAFRLGAWGYVIKVHASKDLPRALNAVIEGKKFVGSGIEAPDMPDPVKA